MPILHWFHTSDFDFAVVLVVAVVFVLIAYATRRSSWAVFGTIGFFAATIHYVGELAVGGRGMTLRYQRRARVHEHGDRADLQVDRAVLPCPGRRRSRFGLLGFWLVFLGLLGRRRRAAAAPPPADRRPQ